MICETTATTLAWAVSGLCRHDICGRTRFARAGYVLTLYVRYAGAGHRLRTLI